MIPDEIDVPHALVRVLEEAGIQFVFGMPGGDTGRIFDALHDSREIQTILVRHEQVGSIMAEMYGRLTGKPGVVMGQGIFLACNALFGTLEAVHQVLATCGWQINTAFIERVNLSMRQHVAAVGRRVNTLCKGEDGLRQQLALYHVYHNFCLPHAGVRQALPLPESTNGTGSAKQWRPCTPAMAAGLTDHVWTLREVLLFRVPPWPQPAGV